MELYLNDVYPYAQQISNYIEREIFQQKLKAGQKLLSITNLSKELNVSKHTIQLSYKILRKKELIVKKGNDFFVTKTPDSTCNVFLIHSSIRLILLDFFSLFLFFLLL